MIEFGKKLKQLREEKGMTQETLAQQLYVTRQAVSRWECGARFPDLLTAKKIAQILDTSIDDLLSGEQLQQNIEKEPLLVHPVENTILTILYSIAGIAYLLMCIFSVYSFLSRKEFAYTPAGQITFLDITTVMNYFICFIAASVGLMLSLGNKLNAKKIGYIVCIPFLLSSVSFLFVFIDMQIKQNGHMSLNGWIVDFIVPLLFAVYIFLFFCWENRRLPFCIICLICFLSVGYIALVLRNSFSRITDLGFVVRTVHCMGKIGMIALLGYQAFIWNIKKKVGYRETPTH